MDILAGDEDDEQVAEVPAKPTPPPEIEYGAGTTFVAIFEDENGVEYTARLEARLDQPDGPSGLMSRLMRLEASFSVVPAVPGIPERLTALEAVADSWGI